MKKLLLTFVYCLAGCYLIGCQHLPKTNTAQPASPLSQTQSESCLQQPSQFSLATLAWQAKLLPQHQLVGKIWDVKAQQFISWNELLEQFCQANYVLIGEKHDNVDHHTLERLLIAELYAYAGLKQISFEMMNQEMQPALDQVNAANEKIEQQQLKQALSWPERGWDWNVYGPTIGLAVNNGLIVKAGNVSREKIKPTKIENNQQIKQYLTPEITAMVEKQVSDSHCGYTMGQGNDDLVNTQSLRDFMLAQSLVSPVEDGLVALVAGGFHVRQDVGVPIFLKSMRPGTKILSLSMSEVADKKVVDPREYEDNRLGVSPFNYILFTPKFTDIDYCEEFLKQFKKMKSNTKQSAE